jgi:hypothetical protein
MTAPKPGQTVCGRCGDGMIRRAVAYLCGGGGPGPVYGDPECSNPQCPDVLEEQADRRRAQADRDEAALEAAIARGVIDR